MSNERNTVVSGGNYIKSTCQRGRNAFKSLSFWREFIAYFILGSMGLWLPAFLSIPSASKVFEPLNVLTFGVATLCITLEARLFMSTSDDDQSSGVTKLIVLVGVFFLGIGYVKGVMTNGNPIILDINWVHISLFLTIIVWLINHINTSRYNERDVNNMLGGDV
ncbi:hypothetical protein J4G63_14685 [Aeromonas sobria]|uniref:hypothetical protein n=1 Tax=Aeromonas sobria TaxID=646 RepID=UPI001114A344|nr:hypothetical protein [Aeromonas sobria]MBS4688485.1 hypothetical protein [Aeromonas sobria]